MTISTNQLMTYGAVAFAGYALWHFSMRPGRAASVQPGQQARDAGLQVWMQAHAAQANEIQRTSYALSAEQFKHLLGQK